MQVARLQALALDDAMTLPVDCYWCVRRLRATAPPEIPTLEKCDILLRFSLLQTGGTGCDDAHFGTCSRFFQRLKMLWGLRGAGVGEAAAAVAVARCTAHTTSLVPHRGSKYPPPFSPLPTGR